MEHALEDCGPVLVVDDDAATRALVREILEGDGLRIVEAANGQAALASARFEEPSLAVLDVNMPLGSGYEVCDALRRLFGARLPIMFLSGDRTESYDRVAGLLVGADDYVVKPFAPDELLIRVRGLLRRFESPSRNGNGRVSPLTPREREVLALLAEGLEQSEIATRLVISSKTVATHIERILSKLGARSRAQAVAIAYRDGFVNVASLR